MRERERERGERERREREGMGHTMHTIDLASFVPRPSRGGRKGLGTRLKIHCAIENSSKDNSIHSPSLQGGAHGGKLEHITSHV